MWDEIINTYRPNPLLSRSPYIVYALSPGQQGAPGPLPSQPGTDWWRGGQWHRAFSVRGWQCCHTAGPEIPQQGWLRSYHVASVSSEKGRAHVFWLAARRIGCTAFIGAIFLSQRQHPKDAVMKAAINKGECRPLPSSVCWCVVWRWAAPGWAGERQPWAGWDREAVTLAFHIFR